MATVATTKVRWVFEKHEGICAYCGTDLNGLVNNLYTTWTIDHIIPKSRGGGGMLAIYV